MACGTDTAVTDTFMPYFTASTGVRMLPIPKPATDATTPARMAIARTAALKTTALLSRFYPDTAVVHLGDLFQDHLFPVLRVFHRHTLEVEIFRVNRRFIKPLVQLAAKVF